MDRNIPDRLRNEQRDVEAQIREVFRGVTRVGGVSWRESAVVDDGGSDAERAAARGQDRETTWESLVDDTTWDEDVRGFTFMDPIGYRYYMATAMIRCTRHRYGSDIQQALTIDGEIMLDPVSLFTPAQRAATARFVRFMIAVHSAADDEIYSPDWRRTYLRYWKQFDAGSPMI